MIQKQNAASAFRVLCYSFIFLIPAFSVAAPSYSNPMEEAGRLTQVVRSCVDKVVVDTQAFLDAITNGGGTPTPAQTDALEDQKTVQAKLLTLAQIIANNWQRPEATYNVGFCASEAYEDAQTSYSLLGSTPEMQEQATTCNGNMQELREFYRDVLFHIVAPISNSCH